MKKLYSFVILMMFATFFSMTAVAQHYVKIVNNTTSINGTHYKSGDILPVEIDSAKVCYIHIIEDNGSANNIEKGITKGGKFLIETFDSDITKVEFYDNAKDRLRSNCFRQAEILVSINDDYLKFIDISFLSSAEVNKSRDAILQEIKKTCVFDTTKGCLDFTKCPYPYIFNNNEYKGDKQYMSPDTQITFLTTGQNVPNIKLFAKELATFSGSNNGSAKDSGFILWIKENWIIALCVLLIIIGILAFLAYKILYNKHSKKGEGDFDDDVVENSPTMKKKHLEQANKRDKIREPHDKVTKETANQNSVDSVETTLPVVDEKLHQKLADVLARIETTQNAVSKQTATLESIKLLVSNTEDKKQLAQKIQELEAEKKKSANAIAQRDAALSDIEKLKGNIAQLQTGSQIEGALQVAECSAFVSFAKKIISECVEAENIAIRYWSSLNSKDQQVLNGFLSKFYMTKCCVDLAKWNGIIATLDLKGYIKNDEYITYLTPLSDKDRIVFLNKRFFEDILRPYVGAIILFLEQIRTANKIGVSTVCNENIDGFINSICTRCHDQGVFVDYRKLYEKVTEYDSLEIDENVPDIIKKVIAKVEEEDTLLYVDKYAVNLKSGEMAEKTRCYIKI